MTYPNGASIRDLAEWGRTYVASRPPDREVGRTDGKPGMLRWYVVPRNNFGNVYLHKFVGSDSYPHDHPFDNVSLILDGYYLEHLVDGISITRFTGDRIARPRQEIHRIELVAGPCLSLFVTGPTVLDAKGEPLWGFLLSDGWKPWRSVIRADAAGNTDYERDP